MIKKILVGFDGSDLSYNAFQYALDLARKYESEIEVIGVIRLPDFGGGAVESTAMIEDGTTNFHHQSRRLRDLARDSGIPIHYHIEVGHPANQIVNRAKEEDFDLIVLGHRGKSLIERWLTGSTTKQVMGYAHCPVLVVR